MRDDALRMNRFSLRFADPGLEAAFTADQMRKVLRPARVTELVSFAAVFCFWALLDQSVPQVPHARTLFFVPMFAILAIIALTYAFTYTQAFLKHYGTGGVMSTCAIAAVFAWIAAIAPPETVMLAGMLIVMVIHTLNVYSLLRLRFPAAVAGGWLNAAIYLGYLGYAQVLTGDDFLRSCVGLTLANVFGMLAAYQLDLFARREFVAMHLLADASRHKSEFLANMSHELRTPLNAILGFSEVLIEKMFGELNAKQEDYLKDIHSSGRHLLSLINDILDLSKVEAGRMELELATFSLPAAIDNALTLVKERAGRHGIALECAIDPALGDIHADERKFKQILVNLLSNAVKFTPAGGCVTVAARALEDAIEVSVSDTGVGIAAQDREAVFEEFRQVGPSSDGKSEGTGLGLALARKFVELHGGRIRVTSEIGKGSTFTFSLAKDLAREPGAPAA